MNSFRFEVAECWRRLLLASVVGIADSNSAAAPTIGLLISQCYVFVFMKFLPFKRKDDNDLAIVLAFSLVFFFLAALMIKVDATGDSAQDQRTFDIILITVLGSGPLFLVLQYVQTTLSVGNDLFFAANLLAPTSHNKKKNVVEKKEIEDVALAPSKDLRAGFQATEDASPMNSDEFEIELAMIPRSPPSESDGTSEVALDEYPERSFSESSVGTSKASESHL
jgi:hypothetical protein